MVVNILVDKISSTFGINRIVCFLYFGSNAFKLNVNNRSDYDFLLLLDKYNKNDLSKLRRIVSTKMFGKTDLNLNILYQRDILKRGLNDFQLRSLRPDFYSYLETTICLIGNNFFERYPLIISNKKLCVYVDFKI